MNWDLELMLCVSCEAPVPFAFCNPDEVRDPRRPEMMTVMTSYVCPSCHALCHQIVEVEYDRMELPN